jgi:hypothetical protein
MGSDSRKGLEAEGHGFGPEAIEGDADPIRETIERLVDEELEATLGAGKSARVGAERQGYRHGTAGKVFPVRVLCSVRRSLRRHAAVLRKAGKGLLAELDGRAQDGVSQVGDAPAARAGIFATRPRR